MENKSPNIKEEIGQIQIFCNESSKEVAEQLLNKIKEAIEKVEKKNK